jgi:hypothetical protein
MEQTVSYRRHARTVVTPPAGQAVTPMIESLLRAAARVTTLLQQRVLTNASGFFSERNDQLFLATRRHVMIDEPGKHFPDRSEIELHTESGVRKKYQRVPVLPRKPPVSFLVFFAAFFSFGVSNGFFLSSLRLLRSLDMFTLRLCEDCFPASRKHRYGIRRSA